MSLNAIRARAMNQVLGAGVSIDGLDALDKRMEELKKNGKVAVMRSAIRGGLNAIGKQMKADLAPDAKQGKVAVKSKFKKGKKRITAKVGFGVGKKRGKTYPVNRKGNRKSGVGIDGNNVHWWVAGTDRRWTGAGKGRKRGGRQMYRGSMPAMQPGLATIAYAKSKGKVKAEMIRRGALQLEKEAKKLQRIN